MQDFVLEGRFVGGNVLEVSLALGILVIEVDQIYD